MKNLSPEIFIYFVIPIIAGIIVTIFHKPLQKFKDWAFADENPPPEKITFKIIERITETHSETNTVYKPSVGINTKNDVITMLIPQKEEQEITAYYFILEDNSCTKFRAEVSKKNLECLREQRNIFRTEKEKFL